MLSKNPDIPRFTDGVVSVMDSTPSRMARGVDFSTGAGLTVAHIAPFCAVSCRANDVAMASERGFELTRKVRVPRCAAVESPQTVMIGDSVYSVGYVDTDKTTAFLYVTQLKTDGTVDLVKTSTTYDTDRVAHDTETTMTVHVRKASEKTARTTDSDQDRLQPTMILTLRTVDYDGEAVAVRGGLRYSVISVAGNGDWRDVTLSALDGDGVNG